MQRFWTSHRATVAFALLILAGSLLWGGVAFWRLRTAQRSDALATQHLQRQLVRQLGAEIQQRVREVTHSLWPTQASRTPTRIAREMQRQLKPGSWIWHAVMLDRQERMLWPKTPWEGPDDARILSLGLRADCRSFRRSLRKLRAGVAAALAASARLLKRHPRCDLAQLLRPLLLQDLHAQSRPQRRWQFTSSDSRSLWVMQGPGHLLVLRFLHHRYVGIALPLHMAQESLLPPSQRRQVARLWIAPESWRRSKRGRSAKQNQRAGRILQRQGEGQTHWFPLSGVLAGHLLWVKFRPIPPASQALWVLIGLSLLLTWCAGVALLVISYKRAAWDARKSALFHAITHELKTPVAAQVALLETMARLEPALASSRYIGALQGETTRLEQLLHNILALHHERPGKVPLARLDLTAHTHQLIEEFDDQAAMRGILLSCDERTPIWVMAEPTTLALALRNLIDNACKYTPEEGWVQIDLVCKERMCHWTIRDSGPGISDVLRAQIFVPFVRGESREVPGSGLGLALAHKLISQLGGRLTLLPGPQSEGGFCVTIPVSEADN